MVDPARTPLILGNSKMNLTIARAIAFLDRFLPSFTPAADRELALGVPFTALAAVGELIRDRGIGLAAQNIFWEDEGPYTGEISGRMLDELKVSYALVGHSERRTHMGENDRMINRKVRAALRNRIRPVLCIGETESQRAAGRAETTLRDQIGRGLEGVTPAEANGLLVAYEPIWAIGTGQAASPQDAAGMHTMIRAELDRRFGSDAGSVRILYGGSVVAGNIDALMAQPEIDGVLVGGASLLPEEFLRIVEFLPARQ